MKRVLITGATGFIGLHAVSALTQRGYEVHCLVRQRANTSRLSPFKPTFHVGDVSDRASVSEALKGIDAVFHMAGITKARTNKEFFDVNALGTKNIVELSAQQPNPPTVIVVSSLAAVGPARSGEVDEMCNPMPVSRYGQSKLEGEKLAIQYASQVPLTVIRPPIVLGEGDMNGLTLFQGIAKVGLHVVPGWKDHLFSVISGEDMALAMIAVAENGKRVQSTQDCFGEGFYFASESKAITYADLGRMIGLAVGRERINVLYLPNFFIRTAAALNEGVSKITGKPHILNIDKAREATAGSWACNSDKIRRETGFVTSCTFQERMNRTARWYCNEGWLTLPSNRKNQSPTFAGNRQASSDRVV